MRYAQAAIDGDDYASALVRPASQWDLDSLCALYYEFHDFHVRGAPDFLRALGGLDNRARTDLCDRLRQIIGGRESTILVAEVAEHIVGFAELYIRQGDPANRAIVAKRHGYLQSLMVTESYRGLGVGSRLLEASHEWARSRGAAEMHLETWEFAEGPLGFYEKAGYRTVKRTLTRGL